MATLPKTTVGSGLVSCSQQLTMLETHAFQRRDSATPESPLHSLRRRELSILCSYSQSADVVLRGKFAFLGSRDQPLSQQTFNSPG